MDMSKAFDLTLKKFEIKATYVADQSGIGESDVSRFRNGKTDVGYQKVQKFLAVLSPVQLDYFWLLFKCDESEGGFFDD